MLGLEDRSEHDQSNPITRGWYGTGLPSKGNHPPLKDNDDFLPYEVVERVERNTARRIEIQVNRRPWSSVEEDVELPVLTPASFFVPENETIRVPTLS